MSGHCVVTDSNRDRYGTDALSLIHIFVNPDIVLRDLVKIFHPELVQEECVYYKQLK